MANLISIGNFLLLRCGWTRREVGDLQKENREMKQTPDVMRLKVMALRGRRQERERKVFG